MAAGAGAGSLDGGANGLVLDVYREGRGRAMNLLHLSFSVGALAAPLIVGTLVASGVPWQTVAIGTGVVVSCLAVAYVIVPMPSGRRAMASAGRHAEGTSGEPPTSVERGGGRLLAGPLLLLGIAIASYVASEVGVSNWLVRFLEPAPLTTATLALSLYWAGLAVGRLVSSVIADRFDHLRFTIASALAMAVLVTVAILVPSLPLSIAAFAAAGVASGPVFPMIIAIGGERHPGALGGRRRVAHRDGGGRLDDLPAGNGLHVRHGWPHGRDARERAHGARVRACARWPSTGRPGRPSGTSHPCPPEPTAPGGPSSVGDEPGRAPRAEPVEPVEHRRVAADQHPEPVLLHAVAG